MSQPATIAKRVGRRSHRARGAGAAAAAIAALLVVGVGSRPEPSASTLQLGEGAWSWFGDPRAVYSRGAIFAGWVSPTGWVMAARWSGGRLSATPVAKEGRPDDHDSPALLVGRDGRLTIFYSHHGGHALHWRVSAAPREVRAWSPEQTLGINSAGPWGYTYPNPLWLPAERRVWLLWRGGDWQPTFAVARSVATLRAGTARRLIAAPGRPYLKVATDRGSRIALAFTDGHPGEQARPTSLYYAEYRAGSVRRASGRRIASVDRLPLRPRQVDLVYDGPGHGMQAWLDDVAFGQDGRPVIAFSASPGNGHRYFWARWTGRRWDVVPLANGGGSISPWRQRYYDGGIALDPADPRTVYASCQRRGEFDIVRLRTTDGGRSWQRRWMTRPDGVDDVRPVVPRGLPPGRHALLWLHGHYNTYFDFETTVVGRQWR
jgi:hypothetical protein